MKNLLSYHNNAFSNLVVSLLSLMILAMSILGFYQGNNLSFLIVGIAMSLIGLLIARVCLLFNNRVYAIFLAISFSVFIASIYSNWFIGTFFDIRSFNIYLDRIYLYKYSNIISISSILAAVSVIAFPLINREDSNSHSDEHISSGGCQESCSSCKEKSGSKTSAYCSCGHCKCCKGLSSKDNCPCCQNMCCGGCRNNKDDDNDESSGNNSFDQDDANTKVNNQEESNRDFPNMKDTSVHSTNENRVILNGSEIYGQQENQEDIF